LGGGQTGGRLRRTENLAAGTCGEIELGEICGADETTNMKKFKILCLLAIALDFVVTIYYCEQRTPDKQLLYMATTGFFFILLLVALVIGFCFCFRDKFRAFVPALICIIGLLTNFYIGVHVGGAIKSWRFHKNLPRYTEVIDLIEKGEIKNSSTNSYTIELPPQFSDLAQRTWLRTNSEGVIFVEFLTELGFPVKHSGYLYISAGKIESDPDTLQRWPYYSEINSNWFCISD
jgi:hypothetical protein